MDKIDIFDELELFDPIEWNYKGDRRVGIVWDMQKGVKILIFEFIVPGTHYEKFENETESLFLLTKEETKIEKTERVVHLGIMGERKLRRALPRTTTNEKGQALYNCGKESSRPISTKEAFKIFKEEIEHDRI